jgi:segregation and condensation protein B
MSLKAKVEAIIYAAEEPVTLEQISVLLKDIVLADLASAKENAAIGEADAAAEALDALSGSAESALITELTAEDAELPEPGPLMPESTTTSAYPSPDEAAAPQGGSGERTAADEPQPESPVAEPVTVEAETPDEGTPASGEAAQPEAETTSDETVGEPVSTEPAPAESAAVAAPETTSRKRQPKKTEQEIAEDKAVRTRVREVLSELIGDYSSEDRGMEIRQVAGGFRMATKPEHHDVVRAFAKSLKPPIRLSLAALETLAVIAYKQPVTGPEITDIRGVESASVLGTLLDRKLITTAGRKQVIGRPMQYKTSKDFLLRFGLNDVNELPSMEEFSQLASDGTIEITPSEPQESPSLFEPESHHNPTAAEAAEDAPEATADTNAEAESPATAAAEESVAPEPSAAPEPEAPQAEQPQSEADSGNTPEAAHSHGQ